MGAALAGGLPHPLKQLLVRIQLTALPRRADDLLDEGGKKRREKG
jgi:hypothetical protein